jgi:hypothetical protein
MGALARIIDATPDLTEFHHGDCIGSDVQADAIVCTRYGIDCAIYVHGPTDKSRVANCAAIHSRCQHIALPDKPYIERNHDIVDETDILVATPGRINEELRSGTWSTIRYARRIHHPIVIIWPDGNASKE